MMTQREVEQLRHEGRQRAKTAWAAHLLALDLRQDAREAKGLAKREAWLRPVERTDYHLHQGRLVPVTIRREYPYGPDVHVPEVGRHVSLLVKVKRAVVNLLSPIVAAGLSSKEDGR